MHRAAAIPPLTPEEGSVVDAMLTRGSTVATDDLAASAGLDTHTFLAILARPHVRAWLDFAFELERQREAIAALCAEAEARSALLRVAQDETQDTATRIDAAIQVFRGPAQRPHQRPPAAPRIREPDATPPVRPTGAALRIRMPAPAPRAARSLPRALPPTHIAPPPPPSCAPQPAPDGRCSAGDADGQPQHAAQPPPVRAQRRTPSAPRQRVRRPAGRSRRVRHGPAWRPGCRPSPGSLATLTLAGHPP